ncbi:hypothetical protein GCM10009798_43330 [Nocardioides panacihumi]|uniref:Uncharacterized protein n=1 Tax=Nocardioides panacihumi TaxID=400774 RepID=A0ABN2RZ76_9ACTN
MNAPSSMRSSITNTTADVVLIADDEMPEAQDWAYAESKQGTWIFVKRSKMPAALEDATAALAANGYNVTLSGVQR